MSKYYKKIGWQKYEDYIEKQMSSPLLQTIIQNMLTSKLGTKLENEDDEDDNEYEDTEESDSKVQIPLFPLSNQIINDAALLSTFDCWIGHTNFDLTHRIKNTLDEIPGIEMLKIFSRYRFFVGIGQMFNFKTVRNDIEKALLGDTKNEQHSWA